MLALMTSSWNGLATAVGRGGRRLLDAGERASVTWPQQWLDSNALSGLGLLRRHWPLARLGPVTVVTRRQDVLEVLSDADRFGTPYGAHLPGPFVLGLTGTQYARHRAALLRAIRPEDLDGVRELVAGSARRRVEARRGGRCLDAGTDLVHPVHTDLLTSYLGVTDPGGDRMQDWGRALFQDIFLNPRDQGAVHDRAVRAAQEMRGWVDGLIAGRHAAAERPDDVLGRLLADRDTHDDALTDAEVRDNLMGLAIGWLWHGAKAGLLAVDQLLGDPEALVQARAAARSGDEPRLRKVLWEVLRFRPVQVGVLRTCSRDTTVASGTPRETRLSARTPLLVGTHSAMWDETAVPDPGLFDATRADQQYLLFGHGMHQCLGEQIMRVQLPAMLAPLLEDEGLRRAGGASGRLRWSDGSPDGLRVLLG